MAADFAFYPAAASGTGHCPAMPTHNPQRILRIQLVKKGFDKLVDGEASSPATATLTSLR